MIVIYKSKTGFTEKYAKKIANELKCDIIDIKDMAKVDLKKQDMVIYGSRVHAGMIDGLSKIKTLFKDGEIKSLMVFATGGTPNDATNLIDEMKKIPHFYMQSGICYEKMGMFDKIIMKMASSMMKKKEDKNDKEDGFLEAIDKSYDISSDEYILPLIKFVKNNK